MTEERKLCVPCSGTGLRNEVTLCPTCDGSGGKAQPADRDPETVTASSVPTVRASELRSEFDEEPSHEPA